MRPVLAMASCTIGLAIFGRACGQPMAHIVTPEYTVSRASASIGLLAGAGKADITPYAGYPMGGHSLGGRLSRGVWLPLYARAFYFRDSAGASLMLISCDLFAVPAGLQQSVAQKLNGIASDLGRDNVIVAATHTHQGPGNFMSSALYNDFASPLPGFDPDLFGQLVRDISRAGRLAVEAALSSGPGAELRLLKNNVRELVRNRAVEPLANNYLLAGSGALELRGLDLIRTLLRTQPPPLRGDCECAELPVACSPGCRRYAGFDATVSVLEIRHPRQSRADARSPGASRLVFLGVHPTAMADHVAFYSSDFVGFAMHLLEQGELDTVDGFFNGADGDTSPLWERQDAGEARELGTRLAEAVRGASPATTALAPLSITSTRVARDRRSFCGGAEPLMGVATVGGAEDGRSFAFDMGWRSDLRRPAPQQGSAGSVSSRPGQAPKRPGLDYPGAPWLSITDIVAPASHYPTEVPVTVSRLGALTFLALPVEPTSVSALQLRDSIRGRLGGEVIVIGLANEYLSYLTTPAEYDAQEYEGASTLFGRRSLECFETLAVAAALGPGAPAGHIPRGDFNPGNGPVARTTLGPSFWGKNSEFSDESALGPFAEGRLSSWRPPQFRWSHERQAACVALVSSGEGGHRTIQTSDDGHLLLELYDARTDRRLWNLRWLSTEEEARTTSGLFTAFLPNAGQICSRSFALGTWDGYRDTTLETAECPSWLGSLPDWRSKACQDKAEADSAR